MPRSSRHKSHKQSKHSAKDYSDSEEDVKMKDRHNNTGKEEVSVRVSGHSPSGEKRKLGREGKDVKDLTGHVNIINGDASEEYVSSKRRREKAADESGGDRWKVGGDLKGEGGVKDKESKGESSRFDLEKGLKLKESKVSGSDLKSKNSAKRQHETGGEKKEDNVSSTMEKDDSKSGTTSRADSKRKSEKDSGRKEGHQHKESKEAKEKERGSEKERKGQDSKREKEVAMGGELAKKQGSQPGGSDKEQQIKRARENTEWPIQDVLQKPEVGKELEKKVRRKRDASSDKDKNPDCVRGSDDKRLPSKGDHTKDGKFKNERHGDESYGDKYREDGDKDKRQREGKHHEDGDRDSRHKDVKYSESEKDSRRRDEKYREDGEHEYRRRDSKYREDGNKDNRRRDDKYHEDGDRDNRRREDKYREDGDREKRQLDDKYREDGERDNRHRDEKYREDDDRDNRHKKEKHREDVDRDSRHRDGKQGDDFDRETRHRDVKFRDDRGLRDRNSDKSDTKRSKDDSNPADVYHRKSSVRDGSPSYDDRAGKHKDEQGRRRANDKEDNGDIRSLSTKEQRSDAEKRSMGTAKVELVIDRGRSNSRNADMELTLTHSRRRSSPISSSHGARDHYRNSKQEESKYRDYAYEERVRHNATSGREYASAAGVTDKINSSWSVEKPIPKDDSHFGELSADRRLKSDAHALSLHMVDKSPSSMGADCRHLNRSDVRRSLDVEELGQRSGGSKDVKDYSSKEGRGSRELPIETLPGDEDGDNLSVSSPFTRPGQFYSNSKSLRPPPPPPPYRTGVDNPVVFGSSEDDYRGQSINRHRRIGDPNFGRVHGNAWKGVPNWPSSLANGFMPFHHGPPPVSFHPVMQQFPPPPMFGVRPSMELNHTAVPYHISDADRFSVHGRPLGWRNPVDGSCPPALHGWDANNAVFGDESNIYGRSDWNNSRTEMNSRGWETSGDMRKGQKSGVTKDLPSSLQKNETSARGPADDVWATEAGQQKNEPNQLDLQAEGLVISQSSDALERNTPEALKIISEESPDMSKMSRKDDNRLCHLYLSRLDISTDLIQPELYNQCVNLLDMDPHKISDEDDSKILYVQKVVETKVRLPTKTSSTSLFTAINDSVFQKAMSLYKKQREETGALNGEKMSFSNVEDVVCLPTSDLVGADSSDGELKELVLAGDLQEAEDTISYFNNEKAELPISFQKLEVAPATAYQKLDEPVIADILDKPGETISNLNKEKMEVDPISDEHSLEYVVEEKSVSLDNLELSDAHSPSRIDDVNKSIDSGGNHSARNNEEQNVFDNKCGPLLLSDVSSEAVMLESIESGPVNLSRIHHSPESTH